MHSNDTSANRSYSQLPDTVPGYDAVGNIVPQPVSVGGGYPGFQVVTVEDDIVQLSIMPTKGQMVIIDARLATGDITVRAKTVGTPITPSEVIATVLARSYTTLLSDGVGWRTMPDTGTAGGSSTFGIARARGMVDANVASLASFAVSGAGRDGITYEEDDLVVLTQQTTTSQNGPYLVGAVSGGNASLTRPGWWADGSEIPEGFAFQLGTLGTLYGGLVLKTFLSATGQVVDTADPKLRLVEVGGNVDPADSLVAYQIRRGLIEPITHVGAGNWSLTAKAGLVDFTKSLVTVTGRDPTGRFCIFNTFHSSATTLIVQSVTDAGVLQDCGFTVKVTRLIP